jgi:TolB-like protein
MSVRTFGPFRLDVDAGVLFRGTEPVALGRRGVALLSALVERPGTLISKDTLIDAAWSGLAVEDGNLSVQISMLRRVLGQAGCAHWIETMPRRGYRFVGNVDEAQGIGREAPPRLSIVVLPFANIGGDPREEYFVDGVIDSLTTDLSRIVELFVIARNTAFTFKGKAVDVKQVGRELNVRYVLQGAIQRSNDRLRVTVQLVEAETAGHVWADRFDKPFADLFDMQDEIVSRLANTLNTQLIEAEARRAEGSLHPDAMDLYF